jgi:hypothetical protein
MPPNSRRFRPLRIKNIASTLDNVGSGRICEGHTVDDQTYKTVELRETTSEESQSGVLEGDGAARSMSRLTMPICLEPPHVPSL